jgi:dipeptidyl-peptidase 4
MKATSTNITLLLFFLFNALIVRSQNGNKQFEFDDFFKNNTFYSSSARELRSMKDGLTYSQAENHGTQLSIYNYLTGERIKTFLDLSKTDSSALKSFSDYSFSPDETKVLLVSAKEAIYRRSFTAEYYVYDLEKDTLIKVSVNGRQQVASFSPDGTKVAFVRLNNLFYTDLKTGKEVQVTSDGKMNSIINGIPDWVYEEEFSFNKAYEWSPDGKTLAWIRFNESRVPEFRMSIFQGMAPSIDEYKLYPGVETFKYPKAGEPNSEVSVHSYTLGDSVIRKIDIGADSDIYIPRIRFIPDSSKLAIFKVNRLQNKLEIILASPDTMPSRILLTETNKYYIDDNYYDDIRFLADSTHFVMRSERDGFSHIYLYNMQGQLENQVTKGNFDVTELNGIDTKQKLIYYTSAEPSPYQREVYSIKWDGTDKQKLSLTTGVNSTRFSEGFKFYSLTNSSVESPSLTLLFDSIGKPVRVLNDNKALKNKLKEYNFNYKEFFQFVTSGHVSLNGWMLKPPGFDPAKKYPVFMTQYSGPDSQSALDSWAFGWEEYLAQLGYIVVCVDRRGTGGRGEAFRKITYLQLGKYETIDQIETAMYLGSLPYVDATRIGIWGWSFGGYISASCMVKGNGIFKAGIAVAPVTNWRYYDNIYTERFMRTPQENPDGYDKNSPLNFADNLKGNILICHGTIDDNVHVQNTMEFAERLVQANKQFEMQLYTNRNHGIRGGNTTYHLYTRMTNFILEKL